MCGLFGWSIESGAIPVRTFRKLSRCLAAENDKRGGDSWGIYGISKGKEKPTIKRGMGTIGKRSAQMSNFDILMAHTRKASFDNPVNIQSAHPFVCGPIIGSHNGVIYNHRGLNLRHNRSFSVDSKHIFAHIEEDLDFAGLDGYGAFQWVDLADDKRIINLCKGEDGELAIAGLGTKSKQGNKSHATYGTVWSSSKKALQAALIATGLPHFIYREYTYEILEVKNNCLIDTNMYYKLTSSTYPTNVDDHLDASRFLDSDDYEEMVVSDEEYDDWDEGKYNMKRSRITGKTSRREKIF